MEKIERQEKVKQISYLWSLGRELFGTLAVGSDRSVPVVEQRSEKSCVGGSSPPSPTFYTMENRIITWKQPLGDPNNPYCIRWVLNLGFIAFRLHKWLCSDDLRHKHDHPYHFITCVLRGQYTDVTNDGEELMTPGTIRFRKAEHTHSVKVDKAPCWTIVISGMFFRQWGFWVKNKFIRREQYFKKYGHHVCD